MIEDSNFWEGGNGFAVMFDDDGFILTLMKGKEVQYPKTFHVGFPQENEEQVNKINQRLKYFAN